MINSINLETLKLDRSAVEKLLICLEFSNVFTIYQRYRVVFSLFINVIKLSSFKLKLAGTYRDTLQ